MIRHLGLEEWQRYEVDDRLDFLGPESTPVLHRHGVLWPHNNFLHRPLLEKAKGGSFLTGIGGDHLFTMWFWQRLADGLARRRRPVARDALRIAHVLAPSPVRRRRARRHVQSESELVGSWLRPDARRAFELARAEEIVAQPRRWERWLAWRVGRRDITAAVWSMSVLAEELDVHLKHPFLEPSFVASLAEAGGRWGFGTRTAAMRALFPEILPEELLARSTKAVFDQVFWNAHSRAFIESWDGTGVDEALVDAEELRREWSKEAPHAGTAMLLQAAWLASNGG